MQEDQTELKVKAPSVVQKFAAQVLGMPFHFEL